MIGMALLLIQAAASSPPTSGLTAEQALATYHKLTGIAEPTATSSCPKDKNGAIVVCGRTVSPDRLPLRGERFGPGEVVRHSGEIPSGTNAFRGPPQEPSKLMDTIVKSIKGVKSLITGEDPNF